MYLRWCFLLCHSWMSTSYWQARALYIMYECTLCCDLIILLSLSEIMTWIIKHMTGYGIHFYPCSTSNDTVAKPPLDQERERDIAAYNYISLLFLGNVIKAVMWSGSVRKIYPGETADRSWSALFNYSLSYNQLRMTGIILLSAGTILATFRLFVDALFYDNLFS